MYWSNLESQNSMLIDEVNCILSVIEITIWHFGRIFDFYAYITWFDIKHICYVQIRISFLGGVHLSPRYLWILNVSTRWAARLLVHVTTQWFLLLGLTEKPLNSAAEFEIRHFHEFFPPTFKVLSNKVLRLFLFQNLRFRLFWANLALKSS